MEKIVLTRKELYDLVWSQPLSILLKKFGISYGEIRRVSKEYNIPIPLMGHWQKVQFGKPIVVEELPNNSSETEVITLIVKEKKKNIELDKSKPKTSKREIKTSAILKSQVPKRLDNPDKLIMEAGNGLKAKNRWGFDRGLISTSRGELSIRVAPENVDRALRIMDSIIKILRSHNHTIEIRFDTTYVKINGQEIEISLREKLRMEKSNEKWGSAKYFTTGILILKAGHLHVKEWQDDKVKLEYKLTTVIDELEQKAHQEKEKDLRIKEYWENVREKEKEKQQIENEMKSRKENEILQFKKLIQQSNQFHQTKILRAYLKEFEENEIKKGTLSQEAIDWIEWAKNKIDWYDPFCNREDDILNDNDKRNTNLEDSIISQNF